MPHDAASGISYELHGSGAPLMLAFPMMASAREIFGDAAAQTQRRFVDAFADRYRVLVMDYPGIGASADIAPEALTAERVVRDWLRVAQAAGFGSFAFWGYSWGAAAGLQLAARTDRLTAFAIGGWPPLGAPYDEILRASTAHAADPPPSSLVVLRSPAQYAQWSTFYRSIAGWDERAAAAALRCPRLVVYGERGDSSSKDVALPIASRIRAHRDELEGLGWNVVEISGRDHSVGLDPDVMAPLLRAFFDSHRTA